MKAGSEVCDQRGPRGAAGARPLLRRCADLAGLRLEDLAAFAGTFLAGTFLAGAALAGAAWAGGGGAGRKRGGGNGGFPVPRHTQTPSIK